MSSSTTFHSSRCLRMRAPKPTCSRCISSCQCQAITLEEGPLIDPHRCVGCLLCTVACPTGALVPKEGRLFDLLAPQKGVTAPVLACTKAGVDGHLRFPCLGGIPEEGLLALMFLSPIRQLNATGCGDCPRSFILAPLQERFAHCRKMIPQTDGRQMELITERGKLRYRDISYDRREFFRAYRSILMRKAVEINQGIRGAAPPKESSGKGTPERRQLLNRVMAGLSQESQPPILAKYYFALSLQEGCDLCFLCSGVCPTGALEGSYGNPAALLFRGALCVGCGLCRDICPRESLSLAPARKWAEINTCNPLVAGRRL